MKNILKNIKNMFGLYFFTATKNVFVIDLIENELNVFLFKVNTNPFNKTNKYKYINQFRFTIDYKTSIIELLKDLLIQNKIDKYFLIINIKEYRSKIINIVKENENDEEWFEENQNLFIPENCLIDEFRIKYINFFSDDEYRFYYVFIIRKDYLTNLLELFNELNDNIIGVIPIEMSNFIKNNSSKSLVSIEFDDKKFSSIIKIFNKEFVSNSNISEESEVQQLDIYLSDYINKIYNEYFSIYSASEDDLKIFLSSKIVVKPKKEQFTINEKKIEIITENFLNELNTISLLNNDLESVPNFINSISDDKIEKIEKNIFNRIILFFGGILVIILLSLYIAEMYVENINEIINEKIVDKELWQAEYDNISKENSILINNINKIPKIKSNEKYYDSFLFYLSNKLPIGMKILKLDFEKKEGSIVCSIEGESYGNNNVAKFVEQIENNNDYEIKLNYCNQKFIDSDSTDVFLYKLEVIIDVNKK